MSSLMADSKIVVLTDSYSLTIISKDLVEEEEEEDEQEEEEETERTAGIEVPGVDANPTEVFTIVMILDLGVLKREGVSGEGGLTRISGDHCYKLQPLFLLLTFLVQISFRGQLLSSGQSLTFT